MRIIFSLVITFLIIIGAGCAPEATQTTISEQTAEADAEISPGEEIVAEQPVVEQSEVIFETPAPVVEPEPQVHTQRVYVVRRGDTLWSIAEDYYGDGQKWRDILNANPGLEPTRMRVGQQLILP